MAQQANLDHRTAAKTSDLLLQFVAWLQQADHTLKRDINPTIFRDVLSRPPFLGRLQPGRDGSQPTGNYRRRHQNQRFISHGFTEGDPLARPLVKYGWSGQVAASGLEMTGVVLGMYGLHRIHQDWIERLLPVCVGAAHGILAYNNTKVSYSAAANPTSP